MDPANNSNIPANDRDTPTTPASEQAAVTPTESQAPAQPANSEPQAVVAAQVPTAPSSQKQTLSVVALILAIFFNVVGAIIGHIQLSKAKRAGRKDGLALAAVIVGWVLFGLSIIMTAVVSSAIITALNECDKGASSTFCDAFGNAKTSSALSPLDNSDSDKSDKSDSSSGASDRSIASIVGKALDTTLSSSSCKTSRDEGAKSDGSGASVSTGCSWTTSATDSVVVMVSTFKNYEGASYQATWNLTGFASSPGLNTVSTKEIRDNKEIRCMSAKQGDPKAKSNGTFKHSAVACVVSVAKSAPASSPQAVVTVLVNGPSVDNWKALDITSPAGQAALNVYKQSS